MARPSRDAIETFMRITGSSESLAVRKLEEHRGNLDEAVNEHFSESEGHSNNSIYAVSPQPNFPDMRNQAPVGNRGVLPLLSAARSFRPSLLLDGNYRNSLYNQIRKSILPEPGISHTGAVNYGYVQPHHPGLRPATEDVRGTSVSHSPQNQGNATRYDEPHLYGNNIEEEMIQLAIEASKQEGQLHLEDDQFDQAVLLSLKTAEQEKAKRQQVVKDQKQPSGAVDSIGVSEETNKFNPGSSSLHEGAEYVHEQSLWGCISSKELDEAILVETALFGQTPELISLQHQSHLEGTPDRNKSLNPHYAACPASSSLMAQRLLREQQDEEYLASLLADIEKESSALNEAENCLKERKSQNKGHQGEELERFLAAKEASLPQEPALEDKNAVTLLVRMPDGTRLGRRFLKSDRLQLLFDFIDIGRAVKPGTYRLVRSYPRRAFCVTDGSGSLDEVGLTNKQEVLFLELI